jgi:hypothetical protein
MSSISRRISAPRAALCIDDDRIVNLFVTTARVDRTKWAI